MPRNARRAVAVNQALRGRLETDGELPAPLAALGDRVEVRIAPAPGGKGTEIAVRAREEDDFELRPQIRLALREAKSLEILDLMAHGKVKTVHLATHVVPLEQASEGYRMFKEKEDGCVRAVFRPGG